MNTAEEKIFPKLLIIMRNLKTFEEVLGKSFFSGWEKFKNLGEISIPTLRNSLRELT